MKKQVVILAGGLATRLGDITSKTPKSLIKIKGKPFIDWQLELLKDNGIDEIVMCLGHMSDQIISYTGDGNRYGLKIEFSIEKNQLGTGGAIANAAPYLYETFGVLYGDSYLPIDYSRIFEAFQAYKKDALMTIYKNVNNSITSNVEYEQTKFFTYSKRLSSESMKYLDYGFSIFKRDLFMHRSNSSKWDLADLQEALAKEKILVPYEVYEKFYEIGSISGILELESYLERRS